MKVVVYALIRDDGRRVAGRGVSGEALRVVRVGAIRAVVGEVARPPAPTQARLRAYTSLVAALATRHNAILPVRFGTVMDDTELQTVVRAREKTIRSQLSHVRGRVQMIVRVVVTPGYRGGSGTVGRTGTETGAEYLSNRAREQSASNIPGFAPLSRTVARWVKDERVERRANVATVYHLVPAAAAGRYVAAIERESAREGVRVVVSGPWPAYAFADRW
jgi:hypothetical protein